MAGIYDNLDAVVAAFKTDNDDRLGKATAHTSAQDKLVSVTDTANQAVKDATSELSAAKDAEDAANGQVASDKRDITAAMDAVSSAPPLTLDVPPPNAPA